MTPPVPRHYVAFRVVLAILLLAAVAGGLWWLLPGVIEKVF